MGVWVKRVILKLDYDQERIKGLCHTQHNKFRFDKKIKKKRTVFGTANVDHLEPTQHPENYSIIRNGHRALDN